jgi:DNA-binding CsgD family transcriptional regulator
VDALIERESEQAILDEIVTAAAGGRGGAVLVEGEAGIGKTRLLESARARASKAGLRVLYATADEFETGVPLAAARVLLGRAARDVPSDGPARLGVLALDGALPDPTGPGSRSDAVVHALWWVIVELADAQPVALVLDDAQWADDLTLRLLRMAARRARELALALVVAARPATPGHRHAMLAAERAFMRLEPAPLSAAGTARLVATVLGRPAPVDMVMKARMATRGNPLYLRELFAHAGGDPFEQAGSPPQLVRLVADRLARLSPAATALARAVAVLGAESTEPRARLLAGLSPAASIAAAEELRGERVLDAGGYGFTHPVVAAATREAIAATNAAELHARAAGLLAEAGLDDQRVAEHLMRVPPRGDPAVVASLRRAADAARRLGALTTATRLLERAMAEPPPHDVADVVDFERGRALRDAGEDHGTPVLTRVAQQATDPALRAAAARHLALRLALGGRSADAVAILRTVIETLPESHSEERLVLLVDSAFIGASDLEGHPEAMRAIGSEAERVTGRSPGERLVIASARVVRAEKESDPAEAARALLAQRLHRDFPGGVAIGSLTFSAVALLINADALDDAERAMDVLRADAEEEVLPDMIAVALLQQAAIAFQRGDLARCEFEVRGAAQVGGEFARALATPWLVMTRSEQGRVAEAEQHLDSLGMLGPIPKSVLLTAMLGSRGRLRLAQGDPSRAVEDLAGARERNAPWLMQRIEPAWQPLLVEALVLADRAQEADAEADAYAKTAAKWGTRRALGHVARMRALTAPRDRAIALLEEARTHFAASNARLEHARALTELGARRRAAGERQAARAILRDAHDAAYRCDAAALCERARAELLLAGGRPRPPAGAGADALTPAERRVAEIAAGGATNREIARGLYLSPKTVEMHLRSVYRKLDLPGRSGLATALH